MPRERVSAKDRLAAFDAKGRDTRLAEHLARFDTIDAARRACLMTEAAAEADMEFAMRMNSTPRRRRRAS